MTIYRLWVVALGSQRLIYTRHFPHLEKRDSFTFPSISATEFLRSVFASLGIEFGTASAVYNSNSTLSKVDYDYSRMSRSSSSSSSSLNSIISTATTASRAPGHDNALEPTTASANSAPLHNYLPLIVCRFHNSSPARDGLLDGAGVEEHQKFTTVDLIMLVYEKNGHLFICCPRLSSLANMDDNYEQLLLEEQNISLSYSSLQLISASFFAQNKSVKHLEVFISSCMPFGTLLKDEVDLKRSILPVNNDRANSDSALIRLVINEFVSTSFQTFSRSSAKESETLFGTLTLDCGSSLNIRELSKAEAWITVENMSSFSIAKPANCDQPNGSTLCFDLKHSKLEPFNLLHYRLNGGSEEESPGAQHRKLFSYRYSIKAKERASGQGKSVIPPPNCQHLSIVISFNGRLPLDEIKFAYFVVKFSFKQSKVKSDVQTADSSVANLIVRDSIRASFGQVRSEGANFVWTIGQKMPKSGKLTLNFDLLADESKLANLEAVCNFRFDHKMTLKLAYIKKILAVGDPKPPKASKAATTLLPEDLEEVRECQPKQFAKLIEPHLSIGKLVLHTELDRAQILTKASERRPAEFGNLVTFVWRLSSFEYRLLPEATHRATFT